MRSGIDLAIRFSFITSSLHYCGPRCAPDDFKRYLEKHDNEQEVRAAFLKFEGLYPYLSVIAERNGKDFLDSEVVEAYWIGNGLLEKLTRDDMLEIIRRLSQRGLPQRIADERSGALPEGVVAHHDFNVLFMGVGLTSGKVLPTLQNMENCRISSGVVQQVRKDKLVVKSRPLQYNGEFSLGKAAGREVGYDPRLMPNVKEGDIIAIHWDFACTVLTGKQAAQLEHYTERVRKAIGNSELIQPKASL